MRRWWRYLSKALINWLTVQEEQDCPICAKRRPTFLWHIMFQVTVICVIFGSLYHWRRIIDYIDAWYWRGSWPFLNALGYVLPLLVVSSGMLWCEWKVRRRNKYSDTHQTGWGPY